MSYKGKKLLRLMRKARNYNNFIVDMILKSMENQGKNCLDFGSGYGYFAQLLRRKGGCNITCVEIDEMFSDRCKKLDFEVYDDLDKLENNQFDFVYTLNVLEHIEDDKKTLLLLKNKLNKNGKLFIFVPAFQILYSSFDKQIGHYRRYVKSDLVGFLEENNFEIKTSKYMDSFGFVLALGYKLFNIKNGEINLFQILVFDKILFPIGRIFDRLTMGKLFGKNLIIEAKLK